MVLSFGWSVVVYFKDKGSKHAITIYKTTGVDWGSDVIIEFCLKGVFLQTIDNILKGRGSCLKWNTLRDIIYYDTSKLNFGLKSPF